MINDNTYFLGDICEVIAGQSPPSNTYNKDGNGLPFFQGKADFGTFSPKVRVWCNAPQKIAKKGDILISVRAPVGPTNVCDQDCCIGRGLSAIRAKDKINSNYLRYFLKKREPTLSAQGRGSTFSSITQKDLKEIQVFLPPLKEQKLTVKTLDTADTLRQKRKEQLKLLDDYLKSVFLEMFGDPVRNEKGWGKILLQNTFSKKKEGTKCGPFGSALKKNEYVPNGVPVWNMDNITTDGFVQNGSLFITEKKYQELKSYSVSNGDIIISRAGTVGKMCVVDRIECPSIISTNLIRLSLDNEIIKPKYFVSLLKYCKGRIGRLKTGADGAYSFMNTGILKTLEIPLPPIVVQKKFISRMDAVEQTKQKMQVSLDEMGNHFNALMQRYFG